MGINERIEAKLDDLLVKVNILMEKKKRKKVIYVEEIADQLGYSVGRVRQIWRDLQSRGCPIWKADNKKIFSYEDDLVEWCERFRA